MNNKLNCIMLIDDSADDNFFHEREIKKNILGATIIVKNSAVTALEYLKSKKDPHPDLILLDIRMPLMDGWQFLEQYNKLRKELQSEVTIVMLSSSGNLEDIAKSKTFTIVSDYMVKPLTKEIIEDIVNQYFKISLPEQVPEGERLAGAQKQMIF